MLKLPENKTRKGLRLTQCVLFLIEILLCSIDFVKIPNPDYPNDMSKCTHETPFGMILSLFGSADGASDSQISYMLFYLIFIIVPIVGFFFCALDKERNLKNFVSLFCCLVGVVSILLIIPLNYIDLGSTLALLIYILICFLTSIAMMARLVKEDESKEKKPAKKRISKYDREY